MPALARNGDFWSGLVLAALGAYIVTAARAWAYMTEDGPGAGFFPMWYGSLMIVLSLVLVARSALRRT
ncbi:MAG TPA: tripartite tricarboxylate transporter TctB family protein, partial [Usitatibacter sp.]|nr:tripartite tricarboxylate transporter TctB family protein [Usitatibacter sp.]